MVNIIVNNLWFNLFSYINLYHLGNETKHVGRYLPSDSMWYELSCYKKIHTP